jgi:hypothetical protein
MPGLNNSHTPPQAIPPPTAAPVSVVVPLGSPLRIFEHKETWAQQLAVQIKEAILLQQLDSREQPRLIS